MFSNSSKTEGYVYHLCQAWIWEGSHTPDPKIPALDAQPAVAAPGHLICQFPPTKTIAAEMFFST